MAPPIPKKTTSQYLEGLAPDAAKALESAEIAVVRDRLDRMGRLGDILMPPAQGAAKDVEISPKTGQPVPIRDQIAVVSVNRLHDLSEDSQKAYWALTGDARKKEEKLMESVEKLLPIKEGRTWMQGNELSDEDKSLKQKQMEDLKKSIRERAERQVKLELYNQATGLEKGLEKDYEVVKKALQIKHDVCKDCRTLEEVDALRKSDSDKGRAIREAEKLAGEYANKVAERAEKTTDYRKQALRLTVLHTRLDAYSEVERIAALQEKENPKRVPDGVRSEEKDWEKAMTQARSPDYVPAEPAGYRPASFGAAKTPEPNMGTFKA